jgi:hypothetical protein
MKFSSILRTTRNPELDTLVPAKDTQGAVPISKQLGGVKLVLERQMRDGEIWTAFSVVGAQSDGEERTEGTTSTEVKEGMESDSLLQEISEATREGSERNRGATQGG